MSRSAFLAWFSDFRSLAGVDEAQGKWRCRLIWYTLAANIASWVGTCMEIIGPFKHLLCETAHPQFLVLVLRVPTGACLGQYGITFFIHVAMLLLQWPLTYPATMWIIMQIASIMYHYHCHFFFLSFYPLSMQIIVFLASSGLGQSKFCSQRSGTAALLCTQHGH